MPNLGTRYGHRKLRNDLRFAWLFHWLSAFWSGVCSFLSLLFHLDLTGGHVLMVVAQKTKTKKERRDGLMAPLKLLRASDEWNSLRLS